MPKVFLVNCCVLHVKYGEDILCHYQTITVLKIFTMAAATILNFTGSTSATYVSVCMHLCAFVEISFSEMIQKGFKNYGRLPS